MARHSGQAGGEKKTKKGTGSRPGRDKFRPACTNRGESGVQPPHSKKRAGWKPALRNTRVALAADGEKEESGAIMRADLLRFNGAVERAPAIDAWMKERAGELGAIAHQWFEVMRKCGDEVRELLHDVRREWRLTIKESYSI